MSDGTLERSTGVTNPLVLIQSAIERGLDPDKLGKLMDLQERWEKNRAQEAYSTALNACQREMPIVVRDKLNNHTKAMYARLEAVNNVIKPIYTAHGFGISFSEAPAPSEGMCRITADVLHVGGHQRTYWCDVPLDGTGIKGNSNMTPTQGKGSTFSYGKRYLVCMIFNVTIADEDQDGNTYIDGNQIAEINELMLECEQTGNAVNLKKFLEWLGPCERLSEVPASKFTQAIHELNRKRRVKAVKP
jgi:hypothetical protein